MRERERNEREGPRPETRREEHEVSPPPPLRRPDAKVASERWPREYGQQPAGGADIHVWDGRRGDYHQSRHEVRWGEEERRRGSQEGGFRGERGWGDERRDAKRFRVFQNDTENHHEGRNGYNRGGERERTWPSSEEGLSRRGDAILGAANFSTPAPPSPRHSRSSRSVRQDAVPRPYSPTLLDRVDDRDHIPKAADVGSVASSEGKKCTVDAGKVSKTSLPLGYRKIVLNSYYTRRSTRNLSPSTTTCWSATRTSLLRRTLSSTTSTRPLPIRMLSSTRTG